jgi:hypothetical protein
VVVVLVLVESPSVLVVVVLSVLVEFAGSFTTVVSVLFSAGGLTVVVSLFSHAAIRATPASMVMLMYFFTRVGRVDRDRRLRSGRRSRRFCGSRCRRSRRVRRSSGARTCSRRHGFGFLFASRKQCSASQNADVFVHSGN